MSPGSLMGRRRQGKGKQVISRSTGGGVRNSTPQTLLRIGMQVLQASSQVKSLQWAAV